MLIVDGLMAPHLQSDWQAIASSVARHIQIYVHDRANHSLKKMK